MRYRLRIAALIVSVPLLGACASASAKSKPGDRPDLVIPPPPPHVVPITPETVVEPVAEIPPAPTPGASRPPARPPAPRPSAAESKPEAKPGAEAKPPETPQPESAPVAPPAAAPQLRTTESGTEAAAVRASIERTRGLLGSVDYRRLPSARKKAYDDAKRFIQQADDALKGGNAVFALGVATKAETLAKELAGR